MEFKINFIFYAMLTYVILLFIYFIYDVIKSIIERSLEEKEKKIEQLEERCRYLDSCIEYANYLVSNKERENSIDKSETVEDIVSEEDCIT